MVLAEETAFDEGNLMINAIGKEMPSSCIILGDRMNRAFAEVRKEE
jgi:hypothetical protein